MAYGAVASLLQTIDILLSYHQHSISPQFKDQIMSIYQHTSFLHSFIEGSSKRVNNWEETIRQVIYKAEDIIELLLSDLLLKQVAGSPERKYEVCYSLDELEKVKEEIESIANRVKGGRREETTDGSDEEVMKIVSRLLGGSSSLETVAICGGGGMGKTTLAKNAFVHPFTMVHFDVRAGSTVTREDTWVQVIVDFLRSMKAEFNTSNSEDQLVQRLLQFIGRKRYLILLDDVWSFNIMERLMIKLPDYGNGSRIIFTTRSSDLAKSAHHIHEMRLLDEDKSWDMLRNKIFEGDPCPFQLESMGKMIARSCRGHLLSIEVVSGILVACDHTKSAWEDVSENIKIASQDAGDKVSEILYLGYIYLPHHLRPCFLYLGTNPEGHGLHVSTLVKQWVAEGFVSESGSKSIEELGEEYVEDLVRRSLVTVINRKSNGRIKSIKVHDLIRCLCMRQARLDNFNVCIERTSSRTSRLAVTEIIKLYRRVSSFVYCGDILRGVYGSTIRTLILYLDVGKLDLRGWMGNVRLLRVLDLLYVNDCDLSSEVFDLFHLRYLSICWELNIPDAISNLQNLQTLIICHYERGGVFDKLPEGIWRMPQLRHLCITSFTFPGRKGPTAVLENLQTISRVVDFVCSIENLKMIPNLQKMDLLYTKKWRDLGEDYELHNLTYLQELDVLKIETNLSFGEEHKISCSFPPTLKKLSLRGLQLSWEDMKMVASLPNLEALKLRNHACVGSTWETSEGGFSKLTFLLIEDSDLENWMIESSHFPRLAWLMLVRCSRLLEVPYEMADIPPLKLIDLEFTGDRNNSLLLSAGRIQKARHGLGLDPLQIGLM